MQYLNKNVNIIFIVLGKGCNFNCRYCAQYQTKKSKIIYPSEINNDIFEFIEEISKNQKEPFFVHFYGGEPLLYKDKMEYIAKRLCHISNIKFSIITNGSLVDKKLVDFFNKYNFYVSISWDGRFSSCTRGHNIFATNRNNLFNIKNLGVFAIISAATPLDILISDVQQLANEYRRKTGRGLKIKFDEIFDMGIADKSLLNIDYNKYEQITRNIAKECIAIKTQKLPITDKEFCEHYYAKIAFFDNLYNKLRFYIMQKNHINYMAYCCNGTSILNIDLEGNLYSCHNCDTKLGNIYSDYKIIIDELIKNDNTKYYYKKFCRDCFVYPICQGGCKLIEEKVRKESYCKLRRAIFTPIIEEVINASPLKN